jgi:hypothetical protein
LFKRILLTAVLGGGLLFTVPGMALANPHTGNSAKVRHDNARDATRHYDGSTRDWYSGDWWVAPYGVGYVGLPGPGYLPPRPPETWGTGYVTPGTYEYGRLSFTGFNTPPKFYFAPPGIGADHGYYLPYLTDVFGDDYFVSYGFRCNGYRDGYYYGPGGSRWQNGGHDFYRRNADCDDFYARNGSWYGVPVCDRYDDATGYCDAD